MRWLVIFLTVAVWGQDFGIAPQTIRQGETLKLRGAIAASAARMNGLTVPLFPQADGSSFGLMPVRVAEKPGEYKLEFLDAAGSVVHAIAVGVSDAHYPKQNIVLSAALSELKASPEEGEVVHKFLKEATATRYWTEPLRLPVAGCMTSPYGVERLHNGHPTGDHHGGIDQRAGMGAPIRAVAAGTVRVARQFSLRGGTVAVDHGQGLESIYMHMSKVAAAEGHRLQAGDVVGYAGSTGRSTAPHLHWSLYANGVAVNPAQWVKLQSCGARPAAARRGNRPPPGKPAGR
jgi:murein DD-endopeptidase MepM/ murein hydrolase activator NlpD